MIYEKKFFVFAILLSGFSFAQEVRRNILKKLEEWDVVYTYSQIILNYSNGCLSMSINLAPRLNFRILKYN